MGLNKMSLTCVSVGGLLICRDVDDEAASRARIFSCTQPGGRYASRACWRYIPRMRTHTLRSEEGGVHAAVELAAQQCMLFIVRT